MHDIYKKSFISWLHSPYWAGGLRINTQTPQTQLDSFERVINPK
jgi:hypothetical protein